MAEPLQRELPSNNSTVFLLSIASAAYLAFGGAGIGYLAKHGHSWQGNSSTLTSILAVLGVVFTLMSRILISQCMTAGMQMVSNKLLGSGVNLDRLNKMDIATRDSLWKSFNRYGFWFRCLLPVLAIAMSATFKKSFSTGSDLEQVPVDAQDASLLDPTSVGSRVGGTIWAGAILYNTTTSIGSGMSPDQTSWTYIAANGSDPSGEGTLQYYMPYLPVLVAAGSAGYGSYSASFVPALMASVQCKSGLLAATPVASSEIINANNNVLVAVLQDGTAAIQVTSAASVAWTCTATINNATGSVTYVSDQSGNWNISDVNMSPTAFIDFSTTEARLGMMRDIISDCLGTTAGYSGWNWDSWTPESPAYPSMLMSTRLSFATAVLGFCSNRAIPQNNPTAGQAYKVVDKIILRYGGALITTTILLLIQGLMGVIYICCIGYSKRRIDFGILQVIEMCQEAARHGPNTLPRL